MGLFDWIELGANVDKAKKGEDASSFTEEFEKIFKGSFSITIGDALSSMIVGGQQTHIYGDRLAFIVDWESLVKGLIGKIPVAGEFFTSGMMGAAIFGGGGNTTYTYGDLCNLHYGESVNVARSVRASATGKNYLWDWFAHGEKALFKPSELGKGLGDEEEAKEEHGGNSWFSAAMSQEKIDKIVGGIAGVLSALMVLAALAIELTVYIRYPLSNPSAKSKAKEKKDSEGSEEESPGPEAMQNLLRTVSWTVTSRLAAAISQTELIGQATRDAGKDLWFVATAKNTAFIGKVLLIVAAATASNALSATKQALTDAAKAVADAIKKYKWVILGVIALITYLAIVVGASAAIAVGSKKS